MTQCQQGVAAHSAKPKLQVWQAYLWLSKTLDGHAWHMHPVALDLCQITTCDGQCWHHVKSRISWQNQKLFGSLALASWPTKHTKEVDWGKKKKKKRLTGREESDALGKVVVKKVHDVCCWEHVWENILTNLYPAQMYDLFCSGAQFENKLENRRYSNVCLFKLYWKTKSVLLQSNLC